MSIFEFLAYVYSDLSLTIGSDFMEDKSLMKRVKRLWIRVSDEGECDLGPDEIADEVSELVKNN